MELRAAGTAFGRSSRFGHHRRPSSASPPAGAPTSPVVVAVGVLAAAMFVPACATPRPGVGVGHQSAVEPVPPVPEPQPTETPAGDAPELAPPVRAGPSPSPSPLSNPPVERPVPGPILGAFVEAGLVSYYSDALAGRPTASGEPYDPEAATCAHRTLPFGAELLVTMPGSGVVVQCRVNDRGPFVPGRVLDVSRAVAEQLGIIQAGVAPAHVHRLGPEPPGNDPVAPGS